MWKEFKSRSKAKVILESGLFALILALLFIGNFLTLLVTVLNKRMHTITNMFVASLAISDFCSGALSACPICLTALVTSQSPFSYAACSIKATWLLPWPLLRFTGIDGGKQVLSNPQTESISTTLHQKENHHHDSCVVALLHVRRPLPYLLSGHKMVFHPFFFKSIAVRSQSSWSVTVYVGLPTCTIFYCYLRIFKTVRGHNNNFPAAGNGINTANVREINVARTLFVIVMFFNIFGRPFCW